MVEMTRNGVVYDVANSPFSYRACGMEFRFSSMTHCDKFMEKYKGHIDWLNDSMHRRFKFKVDFTLVALVQLYARIETRGFYIDYGEGVWQCLAEVELDGLGPKSNVFATSSRDTTPRLIG